MKKLLLIMFLASAVMGQAPTITQQPVSDTVTTDTAIGNDLTIKGKLSK